MRSKNAQWLEYKARELKELSGQAPFTPEETYRWHSMCYPIFQEYHKEFYKERNRELSLSSLDPLQDIGLMVWFADAGKYTSNRVVFNTQIWGEAGSQVMAEYFSLLGYDCEIRRERGYWRVRLNNEPSNHFIKLISRHLPSFV